MLFRSIELRRESGRTHTPFRVALPDGFAAVMYLNESGDIIRTQPVSAPDGVDVAWDDATAVRFVTAAGREPSP